MGSRGGTNEVSAETATDERGVHTLLSRCSDKGFNEATLVSDDNACLLLKGYPFVV